MSKGTSATRAKNKYRDKTYERIEILGKIGEKAEIEAAAQGLSVKRGEEVSRNAFILEAIREKIERENNR